MNRSFFSVILGGFGETQALARQEKIKSQLRAVLQKTAFLLKMFLSVIIVPGYGMAVAQAQHALREMVII